MCPAKQNLTWHTTNREGYREYHCGTKICGACPMKEECLSDSLKKRTVMRHVWQDALDRIIEFTKSPRGRKLYNWRKETIERSFAEAKQNHGLRFARMLGIKNMREQCFLTAAVQNMKRLVAFCLSYFILKKHGLLLVNHAFVDSLIAQCFVIARFCVGMYMAGIPQFRLRAQSRFGSLVLNGTEFTPEPRTSYAIIRRTIIIFPAPRTPLCSLSTAPAGPASRKRSPLPCHQHLRGRRRRNFRRRDKCRF